MRKGYWDSVIRDVVLLTESEALGLTFSDGYDVHCIASSARKAAARAGIKISVTIRGNSMYLGRRFRQEGGVEGTHHDAHRMIPESAATVALGPSEGNGASNKPGC